MPLFYCRVFYVTSILNPYVRDNKHLQWVAFGIIIKLNFKQKGGVLIWIIKCWLWTMRQVL